jgi:KRAB domain-containing zinc finger protein
VDPLQIVGCTKNKIRRRCAHCYKAAGSRAKAQLVQKVTTSCGSCTKPYCLRHMYLICQDCRCQGAFSPNLQVQLEQTYKAQQKQINDLQQQIEDLRRQLSRKSSVKGSACLPYSCSLCTETFAWLIDMKAHFKVHISNIPHSCSFCHKTFARLNSLKLHLKTHTREKVHTSSNPHRCSCCHKTFARLNSLKLHLRTHTGEKPFSCSQCTKSFADRSNLLQHKRLHAGEKPYVCDICAKSFIFPRDLKDHMKVHSSHT